MIPLAATLADLEERLTAVEQALFRLQSILEPQRTEETPAQRGARLLQQARRDKGALKAAAAKAFAEMGVAGKPVPPEELRRMMAECGIRPEDNLFSRGIAEMREE
jgi:hypothetical protein